VSLSVSTAPEPRVPMLRYFDVVLVVVAAPILLLIGVAPVGYLVGAGAWIALRAVGLGVERTAIAVGPTRAIGIRLGYMLGRLFGLALAVILARQGGTRDDGLAALIVIVIAFTIQLVTSAATRPRSAATPPRPR
jgi:hypothetical protein